MFNMGSSQLSLKALIALTPLRNQGMTVRASSSSAILLATLAVASADLHAFGNDSRGCAYDRPCFTDIARSTVGGIIIEWNGQDNYSHYNLRWSRPGKEPAQVEVGGGATGNFHLKNAHTGTTYTFAVQGCHKRLAQSSRCSPWESQPFSNKVAESSSGMRPAGWWNGTWTCNIDGRPASMKWIVVESGVNMCDENGKNCVMNDKRRWQGSFSDNGSRSVALTSPRQDNEGGLFFRHADGNEWYLPRPISNRKTSGWTTWNGRRYSLSCWR